ncbi:hypothetical protein KPH14_002448 [Odynerus spinipes]|uniref:Uncharacterized protein n=1 Tax=Odynerus spinipes TaxID=1348599 RepID=A0AAD9RFK1_9HYME|nr:hypothetical protein KPH14_002448 [Odynerus spinipes]
MYFGLDVSYYKCQHSAKGAEINLWRCILEVLKYIINRMRKELEEDEATDSVKDKSYSQRNGKTISERMQPKTRWDHIVVYQRPEF